MSSDPILLIEDFEFGPDETIPKGTVGIPVHMGAPDPNRSPFDRPEPNNFHFPALAGTPPWEGQGGIAPVYSIDHFGPGTLAHIEKLDWTDPRVVEARRMTHPWRSSNQDLDNMTQEEAVELVVMRLADMHKAILGQDAKRPDEPAWKTLVRWSPILTDYEVHVRKSHRAMQQADETREDAQERIRHMRDQSTKAQHNSNESKYVLNNARKALVKALELLERDPAAIRAEERKNNLMVREQWLATQDIDLSESGRGTIKAGAIFTLHERRDGFIGGNALVTPELWVGRSPGDVAMAGWGDDTSWWEEQGLVKVWPREGTDV